MANSDKGLHAHIYYGHDDYAELELCIPYDDMKNSVISTGSVSKDFKPICDFCGKPSTMYYYFPELGSQVMCNSCAREHRKTVRWYQEDMHKVFNALIMFMRAYPFSWSDRDFNIINEYFRLNSNRHIDINTFIKKGE